MIKILERYTPTKARIMEIPYFLRFIKVTFWSTERIMKGMINHNDTSIKEKKIKVECNFCIEIKSF